MNAELKEIDGKYVATLAGELDSGLRILIGILKAAKATGSKVTMRNVNDDIKNVFKLTGFINIFDFE